MSRVQNVYFTFTVVAIGPHPPGQLAGQQLQQGAPDVPELVVFIECTYICLPLFPLDTISHT